MHEMIGFFSLRCTNTSTGEGVSVSSAFNTHTHTHTHNLNSGRAAVNGARPYTTASPPACLFPCVLLLAIWEPHWVGLVFLGALLYAPPEIALL